MIRLIYSPYFGPRPYVDLQSEDGKNLFGAKAVGTSGLLNELELRLGLMGNALPEVDRLVAYVKAMRVALKADSSLFFADSMRNDELGTAKVLLGWRDALVMEAWDGRHEGSERLRGLSVVESSFDAPGVPDRWKAVLTMLKKGLSRVLEGFSIECRTCEESLPGIIRECLLAIPENGASVSFDVHTDPVAPEGTALRKVQDLLAGTADTGEGKESLPEDDTFRRIHFTYGYDAFQYIAASLEAKDGLVLVTGEPKRLNDTLAAIDRPMVGAMATGYPQTEQLFLLGLALFRKPLDVNALSSYLRVPHNPLGKLHVKKEAKDGSVYYRALHRELLDGLLENGGLFGSYKTILEASFDKDGKPLSEKEILRVRERIDMCFVDRPSADIPVKALVSYLENIRRWADEGAAVREDSGLSALSSCCTATCSLLEGMEDGAIAPDTLSKWAVCLMKEVEMGQVAAEVGSFDTVEDVRDLVDGPRELVWLGCVGDGSAQYPLDFLSEKEKRLVGVPSKEIMAGFGHASLAGAIGSIRDSLTLITYDIMDGGKAAEHQLMTELGAKAVFRTIDGMTLMESFRTKERIVGPGSRKEQYRVDHSVFEGLDKLRKDGGLKRNEESASSLQMLIQFPFDYVLKYILDMHTYGEAELQDVTRVKGTVAHNYIQYLVLKSNYDTGRMLTIHKTMFDDLLKVSTEATGAVLLLEENGLEYIRFRDALKKSVTHLLDCIRRNGLTVVGTEVEIRTNLPVIGPFVAYVDLLLKDRAGNHVIFDLKWNEGSFYSKKMETGNILQLALYSEAVRKHFGGSVSVLGYWILPKHQLLTIEGMLADDNEDIVCFPSSGREIFKEVCNSYTFRMNQLKNGIIEEGETMNLEDLDYYNKQEAMGLYPLETEYQKPSIKGHPIGNDNITLKGGLI